MNMADVSDPSDDDLSRAQRLARPIGRFMRRWREAIARRPWLDGIYKVLITCIGIAVVVIGLILVPLPGPGWLIVFIGLTVLGSEYHWARRLTSWLRMQLARFWAWWRTRQERKKRSLRQNDESNERHDAASDDLAELDDRDAVGEKHGRVGDKDSRCKDSDDEDTAAAA